MRLPGFGTRRERSLAGGRYPPRVPVPPLSAVILVKNERDRLPDALASVSFADEIVVADTGSTDGTQDLARERGARVVEIPAISSIASATRVQNRILKGRIVIGSLQTMKCIVRTRSRAGCLCYSNPAASIRIFAHDHRDA